MLREDLKNGNSFKYLYLICFGRGRQDEKRPQLFPRSLDILFCPPVLASKAFVLPNRTNADLERTLRPLGSISNAIRFGTFNAKNYLLLSPENWTYRKLIW